MTFRFHLNPIPAPRPRVTSKGWTYYPAKYKNWRKSAGDLIPDILSQLGLKEPLVGPLEVTTEFVVTRPKTTRLAYPRGDLDNFCKSVWDVLSGMLFTDDNVIVVAHATKRWAEVGEEGYIDMEVKEA